MSRLDKAYEMLEEKEDFGTVRNTLEDAFRQIRTCERAVYCENPIVNSVLVLKKRLAEEKNITAGRARARIRSFTAWG